MVESAPGGAPKNPGSNKEFDTKLLTARSLDEVLVLLMARADESRNMPTKPGFRGVAEQELRERYNIVRGIKEGTLPLSDIANIQPFPSEEPDVLQSIAIENFLKSRPKVSIAKGRGGTGRERGWQIVSHADSLESVEIKNTVTEETRRVSLKKVFIDPTDA